MLQLEGLTNLRLLAVIVCMCFNSLIAFVKHVELNNLQTQTMKKL